MEEVSRRVLTFNSPLETGVRAVAILRAAFPRAYDLQSLTALDFLLVHTADLGGPSDLHPDAPIKAPATEVRRKSIESALQLMMARDLVARQVSGAGIAYVAGEAAAFFMASLQSDYAAAMDERAVWLAKTIGDYDGQALDQLMRKFFDRWVAEFHEAEQQLASEQ
jgi:hypothetical protein